MTDQTENRGKEWGPSGGSYNPTNPRTAEILRRRDEGQTYAAIGKAVGLSVERVRQIAEITRRRIERKYYERASNGLPIRAANAIKNAGIEDCDPVAVAAHGYLNFLKEYNCGRETIKAIVEWLESQGLKLDGYPEPRPRKRSKEEYFADHLRSKGWTVIAPKETE